MKNILLIAIISLTAFSVALAHDNSPTYNQITFTAMAQAEISNDILVITMRAHEKGRDLETLSDKINKTMAWAVKLVTRSDTIKSQTRNYQTSPWYEKGKQKGWQISQSLSLSSGNPEEISELMKQLQTKMQVQSSNYQVSPDKLEELTENLTQVALQKFSQRAKTISQTLGSEKHKIVKIQIHSASNNHPRPMMAMESMRSASVKSVAAPTFEAGTQKVTVTASGTIELQ
ncbi:MAG: SIMPL domain-containing protein [Gammaproteobacteria bacterium]|nr:SIMPL domain-containing protein [Gammaproteobacteria bacterium]